MNSVSDSTGDARKGWRTATIDDCRNWRGDLDWASANFLRRHERLGNHVWYAGGLLIVDGAKPRPPMEAPIS